MDTTVQCGNAVSHVGLGIYLSEDTITGPGLENKSILTVTNNRCSVLARCELEVVMPHSIREDHAYDDEGYSLAHAVERAWYNVCGERRDLKCLPPRLLRRAGKRVYLPMMNGCQACLSRTRSGRSVHLSAMNSSGFTKYLGPRRRQSFPSASGSPGSTRATWNQPHFSGLCGCPQSPLCPLGYAPRQFAYPP